MFLAVLQAELLRSGELRQVIETMKLGTPRLFGQFSQPEVFEGVQWVFRGHSLSQKFNLQ